MTSNAAKTHPDMRRPGMLLTAVIFALAVLLPPDSAAQWSAGPGETVRNAFGPSKNQHASVCRGACGMDCPSSCEQDEEFQCAGAGALIRVQTYSCGTHLGCRQHDDCLDNCSQQHGEGYDCQAECHAEAVEDWGLENSTSWATGGGPFDGDPITFEYTSKTPGGPEAIYRCPEGARQECTPERDGCRTGGKPVEPVFDSFAGGSAALVRVTDFRSGRVCTVGGQPSSVCEHGADIKVSGQDYCTQSGGKKGCTWYGFELDYSNATPTEPLICQSSAADEDFLGGMVSKVIKSSSVDEDSDMGKILGQLQKELSSGKSMDEVFSGITITTEDGTVLGGEEPREVFPEPGVPSEVAFNSASGHLFVPMFELKDASPPGTSVEHMVRCSQNGTPVIETRFRLHFGGN
jgi:hypothetical protein